MKKKIHYETPLLIDMRSSDATGAATACDGGVYADACGLGSSITLSYCGQGWDAQWCTGSGSAANTKGDYCIACCQTGTSVYGTIPGGKASYCICSVGNSAGLLCTTGSIANSECNPTGGYAGWCA